jgi:hypothetical protein
MLSFALDLAKQGTRNALFLKQLRKLFLTVTGVIQVTPML